MSGRSIFEREDDPVEAALKYVPNFALRCRAYLNAPDDNKPILPVTWDAVLALVIYTETLRDRIDEMRAEIDSIRLAIESSKETR
jgi:hypothetical protein